MGTWISGCLYALTILGAADANLMQKCYMSHKYTNIKTFSNACRAGFILAGPNEDNYRTVVLVCGEKRIKVLTNNSHSDTLSRETVGQRMYK